MAASEKLEFCGANGEMLAAVVDRPAGKPEAWALWAHCFSCTKDIFAAKRVADGLTEKGIAVLRFDFTGLGGSDGEFANTNFSSNVGDLVAAADFLRREFEAPLLLIGHSLGGAAVLAAAPQVPEAKAVCTIGAPADPAHVAHHFQDQRAEIEERGEAEVLLAGRPFRIQKQFLDDIESRKLEADIANLRKALLVFHAPLDAVVGIENAGRIYDAARHPKSFVSLDTADHLLTSKADAAYVADVMASWAGRYLTKETREQARQVPDAKPGTIVVGETREGKFTNRISAHGKHVLRADEPVNVGGTDTAPTPYDLLLAALGACKTMTMRLYAERKGIALDQAIVTLSHEKIHAEDCAECETKDGKVDRINVDIDVRGDMDEETRRAVAAIAERCPVHRTLTNEIRIDTRYN